MRDLATLPETSNGHGRRQPAEGRQAFHPGQKEDRHFIQARKQGHLGSAKTLLSPLGLPMTLERTFQVHGFQSQGEEEHSLLVLPFIDTEINMLFSKSYSALTLCLRGVFPEDLKDPSFFFSNTSYAFKTVKRS